MKQILFGAILLLNTTRNVQSSSSLNPADSKIETYSPIHHSIPSNFQLNSLPDTNYFIGNPVAQLPFDADLYTLDSLKNTNEFIRNLKSKFKGKALIIDFWATWCGPCLRDIPFSKKLHENNKDLPVEYVYICSNSESNIDLWKKKVEELQLPGTHIFMEEKIGVKLKSDLKRPRSGFPTYVVIDINGKLQPNVIEFMKQLDRKKLKAVTGLR